MKSLAENCFEMRKILKLSRNTVAERAKLSPMTIQYIEKGQRTPNVDTIARLAKVYGCSIDVLVYGLDLLPKFGG